MSAANTVFNAPLRPASEFAERAPRSPPRTPPEINNAARDQSTKPAGADEGRHGEEPRRHEEAEQRAHDSKTAGPNLHLARSSSGWCRSLTTGRPAFRQA